MDYPPRPPPGMMPMPGYPPPGMPPPPYSMPPHMYGGPPRPPFPGQPRMPGAPGPADPNGGTPVTVFVGSIAENAQDAMIRHLLTTCGPVISWKRVQGATGKLQAFGFCEFGNPDAASRAIRILHDWEIVDKKLVVKVDAKAKTVLEEFKKQKRKALLGEAKDKEADQDNDVEESEYVDTGMKKEDELTKERIRSIIREHSKDMNAYSGSEKKERRQRHHHNEQRNEDGERLTGPKESLDDVELEDGKRDIIHREIDKFRETMKIREAEKQAEKERREKDSDRSGGRGDRKRDRDRDRGESKDNNSRSSDRDRDKDKDRDRGRGGRGGPGGGRDRTRSKSRTASPEIVRSSRRPQREERSSRTRSPSRERRSRSRRDSPMGRDRDRDRKDPKDVRRERELEEEDKEKKRAERKARDKEASYQERLRKWEAREQKKAKENEAYYAKESRRDEDQDHEAKKLREFLEDYDDDRDDEKYYKGSKYAKREVERQREAAKDIEDRTREREEIEELRVQILKEGHDDPNAELERRMAALDGRKRVEFVDLEAEGGVSPPRNDDEGLHAPVIVEDEADVIPEQVPPPEAVPAPVQVPEPEEQQPPVQQQQKPLFQMQSTRKKIDVKDVFNQDDDDGPALKKKRLPPLPASATASLATSGGGKTKSKEAEDKKKHIKNLIDKIPTEKTALFEYNIDWDMVDNQLMERRIRPWVNKKIAEYIGEPEPTLTDFICSKVLAGSTPKAILEDVGMVLDDEAEVFVVKMWRLLIYEIENKKFKAATTTSSSAQPATQTGQTAA